MDDADRADANIEVMLQSQIAAARKGTRVLVPKGVCFNCDAPLAEGFLYCDSACREDHEYREERSKYA